MFLILCKQKKRPSLVSLGSSNHMPACFPVESPWCMIPAPYKVKHKEDCESWDIVPDKESNLFNSLSGERKQFLSCHFVDKKNTIEMICFMLSNNCIESFQGYRLRFPVEICISHHHHFVSSNKTFLFIDT